jgi:glyoxylase-like metal-dependent hydrolase (beta-lactamase superfamily II)
MKIYFHLNIDSFANCYLVTNEETKEALIIDPCKISPDILNQIEDGPYMLTAVLVTHNHSGHLRGMDTLRKIYSPKVYAADYEVAGSNTIILKDSGIIQEAGFNIGFVSVPGHSFDSICYKIAHVLFTGDVLTAGLIGNTDSNYAKRTLVSNIETKLCREEDYIVMPGHGPPTSIGAEKKFNIELNPKVRDIEADN